MYFSTNLSSILFPYLKRIFTSKRSILVFMHNFDQPILLNNKTGITTKFNGQTRYFCYHQFSSLCATLCGHPNLMEIIMVYRSIFFVLFFEHIFNRYKLTWSTKAWRRNLKAHRKSVNPRNFNEFQWMHTFQVSQIIHWWFSRFNT